MAKENKEKNKKNPKGQDPVFYNDQLGENASEHLSSEYDNKQNKKGK
jgi:hypothetical protein